MDRLLHAVPGSVALHHDLATAAQGTVLRVVRDASGELSRGEAPLVNDCACCALREDLVPELERLAGSGLTRLAVVELWDSVEPRAMAEVVTAHGAGALDLTGVITAVDPALVLPYLGNGDDLAEAGLAAAATDQRTAGDTWARQLEYAPVLALVGRRPRRGCPPTARARQRPRPAIPRGPRPWPGPRRRRRAAAGRSCRPGPRRG